MRIKTLIAISKVAARGAAVLLFSAGLGHAQTTVSLTAAPASANLPDGSAVPMWGYTCGATTGGACAALNPTATGGSWSPVVITVPYSGPSTSLAITLTNNLPSPVPTSLTIVGQLGGGLGTGGTKKPSPTHNGQGTTWPIANSGPVFTPPAQADRVQSFGTEVASGGTTTTPLTWSALRPGTYLLESGTHPSIQGPMGVYGIVVVTTAPVGPSAGTAYTGVPYNADLPLLFSEIDPVQNAAVDKAVNTSGFSETAVWSGQPGGCGNPATPNSGNCYPPVVNYSPLYYTINGVAFDKTHTASSLFPVSPATGVSGNVLVRMVNAGLRMHVPTIVGAQPSSLSASAPGTGGFTLVAEDGNLLPGVPRIQSEVFLAAGKTYDVMIKAPTSGTALPVFDRQLSLSGNSIGRDSGMLAYISVNGASLPVSNASAQAVADAYPSVMAGKTLTISDPSKGVLGNDINVFGVKVTTPPTQGTLTLNADGTFTYVAGNSWSGSDTFGYCGNGASSGLACTTVTLNPAAIESASGISCPTSNFASKLAKSLKISSPGILSGCVDSKGFPLTVNAASVSPASGLTLSVDSTGSFNAQVGSAGVYTFSFKPQNAQGTVASSATTVTLTFPTGSNLQVNVLDGNDKTTQISDYRWVIEEDRTYYVDPKCTQNPLPTGCINNTFNFGVNFHTSFMPLIATGCTGDVSCGNNQTVLGSSVPQKAFTFPSDVALDPTKRYYISVLPGDAAQPFVNGYTGAPDCSTAGVAAGSCGHGMGGAPIPLVANGSHNGQSVTVLTEPSPYPPATLSGLVYEDDFPLNGEIDTGGGIDTISPQEPGLGGFQITIADNAGGTGDSTGSPTYDMFNMPLSNSLAGTLDPVTKLDACPISTQVTAASESGDSTQNGIVGMILTCPKYESDGKTMSPLAGQVVVKNLWPGRYGITANAGASRIAAGEEWLQTTTLDGQKAHDSFMRIGEPGYFQEFGPAGYHVVIGFANPKIINDRKAGFCAAAGADCTHEVKGHITTARMSRTPDERLYGSGTHDAYGFTQCYISLGDPDGADFAFTKCDDQGNFDFKGIPAGNWKITTFDQWDDQVVDGITTPVQMCDPTWTTVSSGPPTNCVAVLDMKEVAVHQWQADIYTRTFLDTDYSGVSTDAKPGLPLVDTNIRFRDGSYSNFNSTDLDGYAGFNEVFPLFNWYVIETDSTRYKNTGTHVVYDSGGPDDNTSPAGTPCLGVSSPARPCGDSSIAANFADTFEPNPLPADLSVPGAAYCAEGADCGSTSIANGRKPSDITNHSTGRIDPAWVDSYGWQGFSGQNNFLEFGKRPFAPGENGGIHGHVIYASTRPFDDPQLLLQLSWEPMIPHVKINLYKEGIADDGVTQTLTMVDHTETSSFDDWAQGVRSDGVANMNCPGQGTDTSTLSDPYFWFAIKDQPQWLDLYNNAGTATQQVKHDSQFKCYDGMHNWNQLQPAPYDGMYKFPSILGINPTTGNTTGTNCTICVKNPDATDPFRYGKEDMLPDGKYVVEVVVPPGYELVKEEDKNILIGDNFIAPVTQQFGGLGSIFILPDQAEVSSTYNANNPNNATSNLGRNPGLPSHEADTGTVETYWPCVGALRTVPDFISLFPGSAEVAPFAGEKRNLCDRKEVTLTDQTAVLTKFYLFTETHTASHFTGQITDDFAAEFDPYSPAFGEKFAPAYLPVSIRDWAGNEVNRVYADAWGVYNGLNYSTWEVNPPNPTGYGPTMMVTCMNDAGPIADPNNIGKTIVDPLFQAGYSDFCYELPFMPGQTGYFDTPVVPTSAFAGGYNTPDCSYPDATPAVSEVDGDGVGPWVGGVKGSLTAVKVTNGGVGYTSTPNVVINNTGSGGTGATATAVIAGSVQSVTITNGGRGYVSTPAVAFTGGGGSGATATATMTGSVNTIAVVSGGSYAGRSNGGAVRPPNNVTVTIAAPASGTRATATPNFTRIGSSTNFTITSVTVNNAGTNYTIAPTVTFSVGAGNTAATGTSTLAHSVLSLTITNGGSGYVAVPTVAFDAAPAGGRNASGTAHDVNSVFVVVITNPGSGYTSAPGVSFAGGGGSAAAATASIETTGTLTINSLGDQKVDNYAYSGPSASAAPYNQQRVTRHYGFGAQCTSPTSGSPTCNTLSKVTIGGQSATITSWSDTKITVAAPSIPSNASTCQIKQQLQYLGTSASCGELVITAGNGKQSVDSVTVTIGGKAPTRMTTGQTIQSAIDAALPGDLIIVPPGTYSEMVLMWKPVRLQGVGAASSIIDASPHPAGKLNPWRRQLVCLFGLSMNGVPITGGNPYDSTDTFTCAPDMQFSVDRLPLEATVGWDATLNGNLAEQLIEPTIMGAYEGAGITVLGKGVKFPAGQDPFAADTFPTGTALLTSNDCGPNTAGARNPFPGNFLCNPSSIDGLTIKNSSQGGGGIMLHGWNHDLQIANNRVLNNQGTLSGGITIGQGEHPDAFLAGGTASNTVPSSCINDASLSGQLNNLALPYCNNLDVNVHNNWVSQNSSLGDELFSSTPAGGGGVTFCSGSDYYKFNYNWVCGNMSTGDGAGVVHLGLSYDGDIEHNTILFNQSTNPTIVTNGGGLLVMGAPDVDPTCGLLTDLDCVPAPTDVPPSDGTGPGLVINANMIMGNSADSGSGGGLRLQHINGNDVLNFPKGNASTNWPVIAGHAAQPAFQKATPWNAIQVTNNIIANNVAGLDGGGVSLLDALAVDVINNTIVSNNSTASSGVLLQTLFAPLASTQGLNCTVNNGSHSCPQVAGFVSNKDTAILQANIGLLPGGNNTITCPTNHRTNRSCVKYSVPVLANDILYKNRSLMIGVGGLDTGFLHQQNKVTLYNSGFLSPATPAANQASTGACDDPHASYWDIGVSGDTSPGNHGSGFSLSPTYSVLTNKSAMAESTDATNVYAPANSVGSMYCNGSRLPVEAVVAAGAYGWQVPPGTNESNALPAPPFTLSAAAVVDEGNNWVNLRWGPLSLVSPTTGNPMANFVPTAPAIQKIPTNETAYSNNLAVLQTDFFGNGRPVVNNINHLDIGAVESLTTAAPAFSLAGGSYHTPQTLILTDSTPGAVIYYTYTANGTTPTTLSTQYTGPITINVTGTVEAIAIAPGYGQSPISSKGYIYTVPAPAPSFSLAGGNYSTPKTLFLTDSVPGGATIYYTYTTNGTVPSNTSTVYNPLTGITINKTGIVEAIAYPTNTTTYFTSGVSNKSYTYVAALTAPVISPASASFATGTNHSVTMTDTANSALPGFAIYYTTDGTTPGTAATASTHLYAGAVNITSATAATVTVHAIATATGFPSSTVSTTTYVFQSQLASPNFLLSNGALLPVGTKLTFGTYTVPNNVVIYYTTDGSNPTTSSNVYNSTTGLLLNNAPAELVRAIAVAPGYLTSNPSAKLYLLH